MSTETKRLFTADEMIAKVRAELRSDPDGYLDGPLGDAIAEASGSCSLEFLSPTQLVDGICAWLEEPVQ